MRRLSQTTGKAAGGSGMPVNAEGTRVAGRASPGEETPLFHPSPKLEGSFLYGVVMCKEWAGGPLKCEDLECAKFAAFLRAETIARRLRAVWFHVPNEGNRTGAVNAKLRVLGFIPGMTDYVFLGEEMNLVIEMKFGKNDLSDAQKGVRAWCRLEGVPHYTCWSCDEAIAVLIEHGILRSA